MRGDWAMRKDSGTTGEVSGPGDFSRCGRFVTVTAPTALVALSATWLFVGAAPVREAVLWCSLTLLTLCLLILGVAVARTGGCSRRDTYRSAVQAASRTAGRGHGAVPLKLGGGTHWQLARWLGLLVSVPALLALWAALAAADTRGTGTSAVLAEAGAVIERRPIVKIEHEVVAHRRNGVDVTADFTVQLPSPSGVGSVPAEFQASINRLVGVGSKLYVAYVPGRPELGALGHSRQAELKRQLDGRSVQVSDAWGIGGLWVVVTVALLVGLGRNENARLGARAVGPDWNTLRVSITGAGVHTDAPRSDSAEASTERRGKENTRKLHCLVLEGRCHGIPFHALMGTEPARDVLTGARAWLLWHPEQRRGRDVLAELVGDDGWHLPGAVPVRVAEHVEEAGVMEAARPDPERRVQTLDLGAGWLVTASGFVVAGFAVALGCLVGLLLVPEGGAWRVWTAVAGLLAPFVGFAVQAVSRMEPGNGDAAAG